MPYSYREVRDMYDTLHGAGVVTKSLPDWSAEMNQETNSDIYTEGLSDNPLKWASVGIDRLLEKTGIPGVTGEIGRGVGGLMGIPEAGQQIGEQLPRDIANVIPYGLSIFGPPGAAAGAAISAGLSGAKAYTETGSPAAGVIAGGLNMIMPGVGGIARNLALKKLGAELVEGPLLQEAGKLGVDRLQQLAAGAVPTAVKEYVPATLGQAAGGVAAEQAGMRGFDGGGWGGERMGS